MGADNPESLRSTATWGRGEANPRYLGGRVTTDKGYVRISTGRRHNLIPYEHRAVIERLMLEQMITTEAEQAISDYRQEWGDTDALVLAQVAVKAIMPIIMHPPEIPAHMHVHHGNMDKADNRPANLMLLDSAIHNAITQAHRKFVRQHDQGEMMRKLRSVGESEDHTQ